MSKLAAPWTPTRNGRSVAPNVVVRNHFFERLQRVAMRGSKRRRGQLVLPPAHTGIDSAPCRELISDVSRALRCCCERFALKGLEFFLADRAGREQFVGFADFLS